MRRAVGRVGRGTRRQLAHRLHTSATTTAGHAEENRLLYSPPQQSILPRINARLSRYAESGDLTKALQLAQSLKRTLAQSDQLPNLSTYEALAKAFATHGLHQEALRLLDDAKGIDIVPDIGVWNQVLRAHIVADQNVTPILQSMKAAGIEWNASTHSLIIQYDVSKGNLEPAMRNLMLFATEDPAAPSTSSRSLSESSLNFSRVPPDVFTSVVTLACDAGEVKLAVGLLKAYDKSGIQALSHQASYSLLHASITHDDPTCAWKAIERLSSAKANLSEHMTVSAMNLFSRHGLVEACASVYSEHLEPYLRDPGRTREWHLSPLLVANIAAGRVDDALEYCTRIAALPTSKHLKPYYLYRLFLDGLRHLSIVQHTLEQVKQRLEYGTRPIPIALINALLKACGRHGLVGEQNDLSFKVFARDKGYPSANLRTYEVLLETCIDKRRPDQDVPQSIQKAEAILDQFAQDETEGGLQPDKGMYELLVRIFMQGGPEEWEKAFDYLEEMKHFDIVPSPHVYVIILERLVDSTRQTGNDDSRINLLLQEMASFGYLGGKRHDYIRTKLPGRFYDELGKDRIMTIRDRFHGT